MSFQTNANIQKRRINAAIKTGDADKIIAATDTAVRSFDQYGWPDDWSYVQRAADDAAFGQRIY